jgi:hypothetical protein
MQLGQIKQALGQMPVKIMGWNSKAPSEKRYNAVM